jgi:hypothetical protein
MRITHSIRSLFLASVMLAISAASFAQIGASISVVRRRCVCSFPDEPPGLTKLG